MAILLSSLPALEQGLVPLEQIGRAAPLASSSPYPLLRVLLSQAMEQAAIAQNGLCLTDLSDPEARRILALIRRVEARQAASLNALLPFQGKIGEQLLYAAALTLELCGALAQPMSDGPVRRLLDFLLPEYLDEVYRLVNARAFRTGLREQPPFSGYIEIMPGRPLIACHRHPFDSAGSPAAAPASREEAALLLLSAAEREKGRLALLAAADTADDLERIFLPELALLSEQHESQLLSRLPAASPLERLLRLHGLERWLYASCAEAADSGAALSALAQAEQAHEAAHEKKLAELLFALEGKEAPPLSFPLLSALGPNKGYIRETLQSIGVTALRDQFVPAGALPQGADFHRYQRRVIPRPEQAPSHRLLERTIEAFGTDLRYEIAPHPVELLRNRGRDEIRLGRSSGCCISPPPVL